MTENFFLLNPDSILDAIEMVLHLKTPGLRATGRSMALNSLENRVYEVELEDGSAVVAKFYRPGRWDHRQIQEEHSFLFALHHTEIPVVTPWLVNGKSIFEKEGILFTLFPKVRGRLLDELDHERLKILGRYIARIHNVGAHFKSHYRLHLNTETWAKESLHFLITSGHLPMEYQKKYQSLVNQVIPHANQCLNHSTSMLLHGDCHLGNTLWQGDSPFFLDFDDSMVAPPVQDIWMVVRGRDSNAEEDRRILLEGYEVFRPFDRHSLAFIEALRALRMIHYSSWIGRRWKDPSFLKTFPQYGSPKYWEEEIHALQEVVALLTDQ